MSLGNVRASDAPTRTETELAIFFFGAEPEPPLGLIKPIDVAADAGSVLICDSGASGTLRWRPQRGGFEGIQLSDPPRNPTTVSVAPDGDLLIGDSAAGAVYRYAANGAYRTRYTNPAHEPALRPGDVATVGDTVWITNVTAHRIEVFDAASGRHTRSIGRRGVGPGEFAMPLGIASTPAGEVFVVDMLGCRVQVLDPQGAWKRDIGGPGGRPGLFGRPRDVAIGPDGAVFVSDSATQRVHAFDPTGVAVGVFGDDDAGADALVLPGGLAISNVPISTDRVPPAGFNAAYNVLVVEQLTRPGIRVFAWRGLPFPAAPDTPAPQPRPSVSSAAFVSTVNNPHWQPERCTDCHSEQSGSPTAIDPHQVDSLCLSCHDGVKAVAEDHPIGRPTAGSRTRLPDGWPALNGRLSCLTCHDIVRHCDSSAARPATNPKMLRVSGPDLCRQCHVQETAAFNPHRNDNGVSAARACGHCHEPVPTERNVRRGEAMLRAGGTQICLGCHVPHSDPAPHGHLGATMCEDWLSGLRSARTSATSRSPARSSAAANAFDLPLEGGRIGCATCHNPHAPSTFDAGSELGRRASDPLDVAIDLRMNRVNLCLYCHPK